MTEHQAYVSMLKRASRKGLPVDPLWLDEDDGYENFLLDLGYKNYEEDRLHTLCSRDGFIVGNVIWLSSNSKELSTMDNHIASLLYRLNYQWYNKPYKERVFLDELFRYENYLCLNNFIQEVGIPRTYQQRLTRINKDKGFVKNNLIWR